MKLTKVPSWIRKSKSDRIWNFSISSNSIYLTFDDGPQPEVTEWVLDLLKKEEIKATFFCVGNNVIKYPEIYQKIVNEGHQVGNHSFTHRNAWKTPNEIYLEDIAKAQKVIDSDLFRPPYGKISNKLVSEIDLLGMKTVMWSLLSYDFEEGLNIERQMKSLLNKAEKGDVVVFHDSLKSFDNLKKMLPSFIEYAKSQHWTFSRID